MVPLEHKCATCPYWGGKPTKDQVKTFGSCYRYPVTAGPYSPNHTCGEHPGNVAALAKAAAPDTISISSADQLDMIEELQRSQLARQREYKPSNG